MRNSLIMRSRYCAVEPSRAASLSLRQLSFKFMMTNYKLICVIDAKDEEQRGTSYIRWGRKTCENNSTLVYKGTSIYCINKTTCLVPFALIYSVDIVFDSSSYFVQ